MPRIVEYTAPLTRLTPSTRGTQAFETAGRRIGPLYNAAAQDIREAGAVQGQMEKAKIWPFDIYALEAANAPKISQGTTNETRNRVSDTQVEMTASGIGEDNSNFAGFAGGDIDPRTDEGASGYNTAPDWSRHYGEASVGAVGLSRLAKAAAQGQDVSVNGSVLRGGRGSGTQGQNVSTNVLNPNIPVDWKDNPDYNGQNVVDTPYGQFTPHQLDVQAQKYMEAWDRNMAKWNREQAQYWDGPNGWNTRREEWLHGKGGLDDQWQKNYDTDRKAFAERATHDYINGNPDLGIQAHPDADKKTVNAGYQYNYGNGPTTFGSRGGAYLGPRQDPGIVDRTLGAIKDTFGSMFGSQDDEPAATADIP